LNYLKILQDELIKAEKKSMIVHIGKIEVQQKAFINEIHSSFKELYNTLNKREQELVENITTTARLKLQKLSQQ